MDLPCVRRAQASSVVLNPTWRWSTTSLRELSSSHSSSVQVKRKKKDIFNPLFWRIISVMNFTQCCIWTFLNKKVWCRCWTWCRGASRPERLSTSSTACTNSTCLTSWHASTHDSSARWDCKHTRDRAGQRLRARDPQREHSTHLKALQFWKK